MMGPEPTRYWHEFAMALPTTPQGAETAMNIAEWLRGEGFGAPLNLDGARWSYAESRVYLMEAKWALARILREAEDLQPFVRAVRQWVLVLDGCSPPGKRDSVAYDEEKASDLTTASRRPT